MDQLFMNPNLIFEMVQHLSYPDIVNYCSTNPVISDICQTDPLVRSFVFQKYVDNYINKEGSLYDAFFLSVLEGDLPIFNELLRRGNIPIGWRNQALVDASKFGRMAIINQLLLDPQVDLTYYDHDYAAIKIAVDRCRHNVVNRLLKDFTLRGVDPSFQDNLLIIQVSKCGFLDTVNYLLLDPRVDPSAQDNKAIIYASGRGHLDVVNRLLQDPRVDPSVNGTIALMVASRDGRLDVVNRLLQDPRVDPSATDNWALTAAVGSTYPDINKGLTKLDIVNRLLQDPRIDPSIPNNQAIISAAASGNLDVVNRLLLDPRVDPSDQNNMAIYMASILGHLDIVNRLLLDPRVNPTAQDNRAIIEANRRGLSDVVRRLLQDPRVGLLSRMKVKLGSIRKRG